MADKKKKPKKGQPNSRPKAGGKKTAVRRQAGKKAASKKKAPARKKPGGRKKTAPKKKAPGKKKATAEAAGRPVRKKKPRARKPAKKGVVRTVRGRGDEFFEHFRRRLVEARQQIVRRLDELHEELKGIEETPRELEEWAQEEKDRDILIRLEQRENDELRRIQAALTLVDQREYGKCQVCGKPIPKARLEELPTAFRCVDCTP